MLYLSTFDIEPGAEDVVREWIRDRHLPDLLSMGFLSAASYADAAGFTIDAYEIPDLEIFASPEYVAGLSDASDTLRPVALAAMQNRSNTTYSVVDTRSFRRPELPGALTMLRFSGHARCDTAHPERELTPLFQAGLTEIQSTAGANALAGFTLARKFGRHPAYEPDPNEWLALFEWHATPSDGSVAAVSTALPPHEFRAAGAPPASWRTLNLIAPSTISKVS